MEKKPKTKKRKSKKNSLKESLTLRQQRFCEIYTGEVEFFGDGTASYLEVYRKKDRLISPDVARAAASRLLAKVNVLLYLNSLLQEQGLNDANVDKQLLFLINQHTNLNLKLGGIKEYNALKQRIQNRMEFGTETLEVLKKIQKTTVKLFMSEKEKKE